MNDDIDTALAELNERKSAYHQLGRGIVFFLQATLGFEQDVMRQASTYLAEAEAMAYKEHRQAQRDPRPPRSSIYPPGAEYALCTAQAQLMSAVVAVLNESLTESIRGFYKLRKAYVTMDALIDAEQKYLAGRPTTDKAALPLGEKENRDRQSSDPTSEEAVFAGTLDNFIHSGASLCFGLLLILISMIPPAFGRLLFIVGFKGDRERGVQLLWRASNQEDIHGAMAGLTLLGYYNSLNGFCDILPDEGGEQSFGYPKERCDALLVRMRTRYPNSR
ncbi:MAG: Mitochondrial outer membrane protein iml2, partial [Thelocarpon superellum]